MLIILDRDGVINEEREGYIRTARDWQPIPGSIEAIARLSRAGHRVSVASNQSGLSRGLFNLENLEAMHDKLCALVEAAGGTIEGIFYCPHLPSDCCRCRKPGPGLVDAIRHELGADTGVSVLVGDRLSDLELAITTGARAFLVRTGRGMETEDRLKRRLPGDPDFDSISVHDNLLSAVSAILANGCGAVL